ncbi:MAG TPA: trypsin-like peptidase domain-containing protein [Acidobacteriota bacterium]|nr:trypsin-like peptidase domain-containing protein [Acidobacteriota bacterium]
MTARKAIFILLAAAAPAPACASAASIQQQIYTARDMVLPALVHIQPVIKDYNTGELKKQAVIGSGVIFHPDGYVVTNYHVAGKAERIICTLFDKEQVPAEYIGGDPPTDVAVLKLDLSEHQGDVPVAVLGNSDSIQVGQQVLAMGSPLSLSRTVSSGVISTKDRYFSAYYRLPSGERTGRYNLWIQTDAAINPGNSGGPLVDLLGRVVGINSRATFLANNLGFAIPINIVKEVTAEILRHGKVSRSWIGVECQALQELEDWFGADRNSGVLIASVDPGSPAEKNFLKAGDIILAINGEPVSARFVEELPSFYKRIASFPPGSQITLNVLRGEREYEFGLVTVELGDLQGEDFECSDWGLTVKAITRQMQIENQLSDTLGVFVTGVKRVGAADLSGVRPGDIIAGINKEPILALAEFVRAYNELSASGARKVLLRIDRNGAIRLAVLSVDSRQEGVEDEE